MTNGRHVDFGRGQQPSKRPASVFVIGDSQSLTYNLRLHVVEERSYLFRALHLDLTAAACRTARGTILPKLGTLLARSGVLVRVQGRYEPLHRTKDTAKLYLAMVEANPLVEPTLALSIGGLDTLHFGNELEEFDDITFAPGSVRSAGPLAEPSLSNPIAVDDFVDRLVTRLRPVRDQIAALRTLGFGRVAILSMVPPTTDDRAWCAFVEGAKARLIARHLSLAWRTKLLFAGNLALARIAADVGVEFIDMWQAHTRDDIAVMGLLTDWLHLAPWAADMTAFELLKRFEGAAGDAPVAKFYQVYIADSSGPEGLREFTIDHEDMTALTEPSSNALALVRDIHQKTSTWVNRSQIVRIGEIV